ncbi:hypothetical protein ACFWBV_14980 [Streptomyces sp. NPDC060030]|uniref:hypothetical protein n=1 Tax=Streptomyces sp. NPDC060030 TaxID=3347042 RepID=UPI0036B609CA
MLVTFVTAALAIVGTLLGSIVSGRFQERAAERSVRVTHGEAIRRDQLEAVTALASAVSDHRQAMWKRADAALAGASADVVASLREASHQTRAAVTRPHVALRVLITDPAVREAADQLISLTYGMRQPYATVEDLSAVREAAKDAEDAFVDAAAGYFSRTA